MIATVTHTNIGKRLAADGIMVAAIDMPGKAMNVFSDELMDSLEQLIDEVSSSSEIRGVVLTSAKKSFLAGADLHMIRQYIDKAQTASDATLHTLCGRLGRLFRRLETVGKPFVAAVHGLTLGGGLELALACHHRIVSDSPNTKLGLPEIKLGLLPGAGGTQRLPRLLGPKAAFSMLLGGEALSASEALKCSLVHEVIAEDALLTTAIQRAHQLASKGSLAPWDRNDWRSPMGDYDFNDPLFSISVARDAGIADELLTQYPAYAAIMQAVAGGWSMSMDDGIGYEMNCFVGLIQNPVAGNMVRTLFLNRQRAGKILSSSSRVLRPRNIYFDGNFPEAVEQTFREANIATPLSQPPVGALVVTQRRGPTARVGSLAWLRDTHLSLADFGVQCGVYIAESTALGRTIEFCTIDGTVDDAWLDIARWLHAVPLMTRRLCLLQQVAATVKAASEFSSDDGLLALALQAARVWRDGAVDDVELADVALVVAGFAPPYSGGLFTYLRQTELAEVRARAAFAAAMHGRLFEVPDDCAALFRN